MIIVVTSTSLKLDVTPASKFDVMSHSKLCHAHGCSRAFLRWSQIRPISSLQLLQPTTIWRFSASATSPHHDAPSPRRRGVASAATSTAPLAGLPSPKFDLVTTDPPRERPVTGRVCSDPRGQTRPQRAAADCRGHRRALLGGALAARGPLRVTTPGRRSCGSAAHCSERAPLTLGDRREPLDDCGVALVARSSTEHGRESRLLCRLWWRRVAAAAAARHQPASHWPRRWPPAREGR